MLLVSSRTGVLYLAAAAVIHAVLVWRRRVRYPGGATTWAAVLLPLLVVVVIIVGSGGTGFLTQARYDNGADITSGRTATWAQVWREFRSDDVAQKIFGDAKGVRGTLMPAFAQSAGGMLTDKQIDSLVRGIRS